MDIKMRKDKLRCVKYENMIRKTRRGTKREEMNMRKEETGHRTERRKQDEPMRLSGTERRENRRRKKEAR